MKRRFRRLVGNRKRAIATIVLFAVLGTSVLFIVKAAPWVLSAETESGSTTTMAQKITDGSASGGRAVKFGSVSQPDTVVAIAGDIQLANSNLHYGLETSDLIINQIHPHYVLALGDTQYDTGSLSDYNTYYSQTWGRSAVKSLTYPVPGNHEYKTSGASGYYNYFSAANNSVNGKPVTGPADQGYYAFNVGSNWRFYAMNSEANLAAQQTWLTADMVANPKPCTLMFVHRPYWDYGTTHDGEASEILPLLKTFYDNGGELLFAGHEHNYQRFQPANPYTNAVDTSRGIRSFVVGTGGTTNLYTAFGSTVNDADGLIARNDGGVTYGVLKLTLKAGNVYDWAYVPISGMSYSDSGSGTCH